MFNIGGILMNIWVRIIINATDLQYQIIGINFALDETRFAVFYFGRYGVNIHTKVPATQLRPQ